MPVRRATGLALTCARSAGSVSFWGFALGPGTTPTPPGKFRCWGGEHGSLGDGTGAYHPLQPTTVVGVTDAVAVAAGGLHACALDKSGDVWCRGFNAWGDLGDGTQVQRDAPVPVKGVAGIVAIAAGWDETCAVDNRGALWCWGRNQYGEVGDGTTGMRTTPTPVAISCRRPRWSACPARSRSPPAPDTRASCSRAARSSAGARTAWASSATAPRPIARCRRRCASACPLPSAGQIRALGVAAAIAAASCRYPTSAGEPLPVSDCDWKTGSGCSAAPSCSADGSLPDSSCTPGALNPAVTPASIDATICSMGWTRTIRPPQSYTAPLKRALMQACGAGDDPAAFELDHPGPARARRRARGSHEPLARIHTGDGGGMYRA